VLFRSRPFADSSWRVERFRVFTIRPTPICIQRTWTSALDVDRYDFAVRVEIEEGRPVARMEHPA